MAAAAVDRADGARIHLGVRAHGDLAAAVEQLADRDAHDHALRPAGQTGNIVAVILRRVYAVDQRARDDRDGDLTAAEKAHAGVDLPHERHARAGDLAEKVHADLPVIGAELQQPRRRAQSGGVRVRVLEAAGVRRNGDVQEVCLLLGDAAGQQLDHIEHRLAAGGLFRVQERIAGIQRVRRVVVDAQIDRAGKALREQVRRRNVDRDHARRHKIRRRKKLRHIRQIARCRLRIGE